MNPGASKSIYYKFQKENTKKMEEKISKKFKNTSSFHIIHRKPVLWLVASLSLREARPSWYATIRNNSLFKHYPHWICCKLIWFLFKTFLNLLHILISPQLSISELPGYATPMPRKEINPDPREWNSLHWRELTRVKCSSNETWN